jgi:16S rRNA pseudouridine516 synthase
MLDLEKLAARNLGCARGEARRLLDGAGAGLSRWVRADALPLEIDLAGRRLQLHDSFHLLMHKPAGCVTALSDSHHPTASGYLTGAPLRNELRPVGRLDLDTTGLLLWTTAGDWLHRLTHPRTALPRGYHAALARPFQAPPERLVLRDGHRPRIVHLVPLAAADVHPGLLRPDAATSFAAITIAGGAYHEVRRIFAALGSHVLALCRVSFGDLRLPADLAPGHWRPLTQAEMDQATALENRGRRENS